MDPIELALNKEKSDINDQCFEDTSALLEEIDVYKYLGIIDDTDKSQDVSHLKNYNAK
ncbi:hypothetical protein CWI36_1151p0010 [Hamiltosporidium magnivora]|uniref:Uncharacterized protein n=1 Tax=Hamiltosporidium magnivora TaxID=148818 RepID=A0A4Q9L416_9MICR|nr:hypothetical protein CWI36_1151p0010 [Hamiltosporidium magnivora]